MRTSSSAPSIRCLLPSVLRRAALLLLVATGLTATAQTNPVPATEFESGQNVTLGGAIITNDNTPNPNVVTVKIGAIVKFRATTSITLKPGFTAVEGSTFRAFIFVDSDTDGMDDAWELQNFGDLSPTASGDADSDGLTNFTEYLLGTNPNASKATDSSNQSTLNIHRPTQ